MRFELIICCLYIKVSFLLSLVYGLLLKCYILSSESDWK